jgi:adenylate cyclase
VAILKITEANGNEWEMKLLPPSHYTIGRAPDNNIVLRDQRVSRHHAQIEHKGKSFVIVDGYYVNGEIRRSVNRVFVNGEALLEKALVHGDKIQIGGSTLVFENPTDENKISDDLRYDDRPLGQTQVFISANNVIQLQSEKPTVSAADDLQVLKRKAQILELFYEMSKTVASVFDLKSIFEKATDLIFRVTPADRVVALLANEALRGDETNFILSPIAVKARDERLAEFTGRLTVSRTITHKVMRERIALLSQDVTMDAQFSGADSIVAQGVRSTICAPLLTESGVHGVVYADRLDPFAVFSEDDLELISAVAAQTAVAVETVRAHERLAREQVARANYSRFLPEYVVKQILEKPDSFQLGGTNQLITVLFADIRAFTRFSEHEKPENVLQLLNRYFTEMTEIIFAHGGTLDKYIGDGLMALFGAPTTSPEDARNALLAAVEMQRRIEILNKELTEEGFEEIGVGIGLHTGEATVGYVGSERRSEYTAIGDTVNLASRLESNARAKQILISEATAQAAGSIFPLVPRAPLTVKNRIQPVRLFEVGWN